MSTEKTTKEKQTADNSGSSSRAGGQPVLGIQMPHSAVFAKENLFDGCDKIFEALQSRLEYRLAKLKLFHTLEQLLLDAAYGIPDQNVDEEEKSRRSTIHYSTCHCVPEVAAGAGLTQDGGVLWRYVDPVAALQHEGSSGLAAGAWPKRCSIADADSGDIRVSEVTAGAVTGAIETDGRVMLAQIDKQRSRAQERSRSSLSVGGHALLAGPKKRISEWHVRFVVDSGATHHMVNDELLLEDIEELLDPLEISTAKSGEDLQATKRGKMLLKSTVGADIKLIELGDVLFVPELESNLFSVRKATACGKRVTFSSGKVTIASLGEVLARGSIVDGLFSLDLVSEVEDSRALLGKNRSSLELWHKRLGHLSKAGVNTLVSKKMVDGIVYSFDTFHALRSCRVKFSNFKSCKSESSML